MRDSLVPNRNLLLKVSHPLPESTEFRIDSMQFICTLEVVATIHLPFSLAEDIEGRLCLGKLKFKSGHFEMSRLTGAESIFSGDVCCGSHGGGGAYLRSSP